MIWLAKTNRLLLTSLFFLLSGSLMAQQLPPKDCEKQLKGFIIEESDYSIRIKDVSKINIVFYQGFIYRIVLCSENTKSLVFELKDDQNNVQYKNTVTAGFMHDFKFDTMFHGQITLESIDSGDIPIKLIIGYKKIEL